MNKLLNFKTKAENATTPIFTGIAAFFFLTNCQRWDYKYMKMQEGIVEIFIERKNEDVTEKFVGKGKNYMSIGYIYKKNMIEKNYVMISA